MNREERCRSTRRASDYRCESTHLTTFPAIGQADQPDTSFKLLACGWIEPPYRDALITTSPHRQSEYFLPEAHDMEHAADATDLPGEIGLSPLNNQDGRSVVTAIRDAADRRREEGLKILDAVLRETRESEGRFSLIADAAPALIWMSGTNSLRTYFNKP